MVPRTAALFYIFQWAVPRKELERTFIARGAEYPFPQDEAATIVDKFFYSCQVVEERIKTASAMEHITTEQVADLNGQLKAAVDRMIIASRQSPIVAELVQVKLGAAMET